MQRTTTIHAVALLLVIFIALGATPGAHSLAWSEIMFNPLGSDNGKEYIELIGNDDLAGCTLRDAASSDYLIRYMDNRDHSDVIMILENDSLVLPQSVRHNATIYVIGSAIGNGLGNTNESLVISCNGTTIVTLSTHYDIRDASLAGITEGESIVMRNNGYGSGVWQAGMMNGTPGIIDEEYTQFGMTNTTSANASTNNTFINNSSTAGRGGARGVCKDNIHLLVSSTNAYPGDALELSLFAPGYATLEVQDADGKVILFKDTFDGTRFILLVPQTTKLKIVARGNACNNDERMTRTVTVRTAIASPTSQFVNVLSDNESTNSSDTTTPNATPHALHALHATQSASLRQSPDTFDSATISDSSNVNLSLLGTTSQIPAPATATATAAAATAAATLETHSTLYDANINLVPWVCAFGIAVLLLCGIIFFHLARSER